MRPRLSGPGRHRELRAPLSATRRIAATGLLLSAAGLAATTWPTAASADAPIQTGWWNAASGGGQSAPAPTTPAGGMHVAVQPGEITAFGAVLYALPEGSTGTLVLKVSSSAATPVINPNAPTTDPAINIQACPTKDITWKAGDNQPMDAAPAYDCSLKSLVGSLSADGKTLSFLVDSSLETIPGELSLAIVPVQTKAAPGVGTELPVDATQPFSVDIDKPEATSLTVTSGPVISTGGGGGGGGGGGTGGQPPTTTGTGTTGTGTTSGGGSIPTLTGSGPGSTTTTGVDTGSPPVVAGTTPTTNAAPAAAVLPTKSNTAHNAALALLILLGMGVVATSSGQVQRSPRLLGGAGRHAARPGEPALAMATAGGTAVAVGAPGAPAMPVMTPYGTRGLGRFAKPRTTPARPLT